MNRRVSHPHRPPSWPCSRMVTQGGRRGWIAAHVGGAVFGGLTLIIAGLLSRGVALGILAILLGAIGAVY